MRRAVVIAALLLSGARGAEAQVGPIVCGVPDPVYQELRDRFSVTVNRFCVQNPTGNALWADVWVVWETPVDSSLDYRCPVDDTYTIDPHDTLEAHICVGDVGPFGRTVVSANVSARLDPLANL